MKEYDLASYESRQEILKQFNALLERSLHKSIISEKSSRVSGNMIFQSKNATHAFDANEVEDSKYVVCIVEARNTMDSYHFGYSSELVYESHGIIRSYNTAFSHASYDNSHIQYCDNCHNSENLFGCIGVKKGSYMILNKQYEPDEYQKVREQVIASMKERGEYGQFFPPALAPFAYNETQAQVYMPLQKQDAMQLGFQWEDNLPGTFGRETMKPNEIPDAITDVSDTIKNEILACIDCGRNYNIVEPELQFYRRLSIPIPRKCPECRYKSRLSFRTPRKVWRRHCDCEGSSSKGGIQANTGKHFHDEVPCPNEFDSAYDPNRPEIVYCEECYQAEVS